jgi:hypothetical protein
VKRSRVGSSARKKLGFDGPKCSVVHRAHLETRTGPADLRWFWALYAPGGRETLRSSNHAGTLDEAKAEFEASWKQWKAWAGMEETAV